MATAIDLINLARKYVGLKESPANSNNIVFNTIYYGHPVSGNSYPWCCSMLYCLFKEMGASELFYDGKKTALCRTLADWFKSQKRFYTNNPKIGDIVFYKFSSGTNNYTNHVGIVTAIKNGKIVAIEGNTGSGNDANGGMVMERERTYPSSNIVGFGRPAYDEPSIVPTPSPQPITLSYPCKGIDVSGYQTNIPYSTLRDNGVNFAILKIIRKDLGVDKLFETHYKGFTNAGIPVEAVYNYSYATTTSKAATDAAKVLEYLGNRKIPVCLDVEDTIQKNLGSRLIDIINAYGDIITAAGLKFIVYTGMSFFNSYIKPYLSTLKYKDFWIARYYLGYKTMTITEAPSTSYVPAVSGVNLLGWQYTSTGRIGGYNADLDFDILYSPIRNNHDISSKQTAKLKPGVNGLNYRSSDSTAGSILGVYKPVDTIIIIGRSEKTGWYQTSKGWVSDKYIVFNN